MFIDFWQGSAYASGLGGKVLSLDEKRAVFESICVIVRSRVRDDDNLWKLILAFDLGGNALSVGWKAGSNQRY